MARRRLVAAGWVLNGLSPCWRGCDSPSCESGPASMRMNFCRVCSAPLASHALQAGRQHGRGAKRQRRSSQC